MYHTCRDQARHEKKVEEWEGSRRPLGEIKAGGEVSEEVLLDLCSRIWGDEQVPEEWEERSANQAANAKKGDLSYM